LYRPNIIILKNSVVKMTTKTNKLEKERENMMRER